MQLRSVTFADTPQKILLILKLIFKFEFEFKLRKEGKKKMMRAGKKQCRGIAYIEYYIRPFTTST